METSKVLISSREQLNSPPSDGPQSLDDRQLWTGQLLTENEETKMATTKAQAKAYLFLQKDIVQQLGFALFVFFLVFCYFAIHAWYQGKIELLDQLAYQRKAFLKVATEALLYTLFMGVPVYLNLSLIYKGRAQEFLESRLFKEDQFKGWGFYLFFLFSIGNALFFARVYEPIFQQVFEIVDQQWYETVVFILFFILCTTGVSYTKESFDLRRKRERAARQEAIRKRRAAERSLDYIKKQIRPHFLFNTLTNLQILARQKSENVPELIGELSRLLRHLVYKTNEKLVPLEEEIEFIESYVNLQRLQTNDDTELCFQIEGEIKEEHRIAPMILLLFIENCFKHYNQKDNKEKFIRIKIKIEANQLCLNACNTFKPNMRNEDNFRGFQRKGVGVQSAKENLELIYDQNYELNILAENNVYRIKLMVPLT